MCAVHVMPGLYVAQKSTPIRNPEVLAYARLPCLLSKAFGAYRKKQATNHIEADSCEGKKLPKYYLFLAEHLYLHLVIYL